MICVILFLCFPEDMFNDISAALVKYFKIALLAIKYMIEAVNLILQRGFYFDLFIVQVFYLFRVVVLSAIGLELYKYLQ
jgi:hypothetical protein